MPGWCFSELYLSLGFVVGCFHGSVCAGCSVCLCSADDFLWCLMVVVVDWVLWFVLGDLGVFFCWGFL